MKKKILNAILAICSVYCAIFSVYKFVETMDDAFALLSVLFGLCAIAFIGWSIENTKVADYMANFFAGEEDDDE